MAKSRKLLFSGDIGRVRDQNSAPGKVVRSGPTEGETADILVMESTYGNRQHPTDDPRPKLAAIIRQTVERGGSVIVPAFAVERTQKFLFMIKDLMESGQIPRIPVYCDSPMAIKAVEVFLKHSEECTDETCRLIKQYGSPLQWPGFTFALTSEDSKKINATSYPSIIVSSSGMVTGGRILHHLMQRLPDPKNTVIFIGFQAPGTRGAHHQERRSRSAHFQRDGYLSGRRSRRSNNSAITPIHPSCWSGCAPLPKSRRLPTWCMANRRGIVMLRDAMTKELGWNVQVAEWMQKVEVN